MIKDELNAYKMEEMAVHEVSPSLERANEG
jgi:hypothetical protein